MNKKVFVEERRTKILEYVKLRDRANVTELAQELDVTEATIRRDLLLLENEGLIHRTHGGVIKRENLALWQTTALEERLISHKEEKDRIAAFVSQIIQDNESIMIDNGSTTLCVAEKLLFKNNLLVVTNSPDIAKILLKRAGNKVLLTGGELMRSTYSLIGPIAESELGKIRTDRAIIGVSALHTKDGLFSADPQEGAVKQIMIKNARETIVVADSSKINNRALHLFNDYTGVSELVTDKDISKEAIAAIQKSGIKVCAV